MQNIKTQQQQQNNTIRWYVKEITKHFTEDNIQNIQMTNNMKRCSASVAIRETPIKTYIPIILMKTKTKTTSNSNKC